MHAMYCNLAIKTLNSELTPTNQQIMAAGALLRYVRLLPLALRVTLAGGATYGTVKLGTWSDSTTEGRETLQRIKQNVREIEYYTASTVGWVGCVVQVA